MLERDREIFASLFHGGNDTLYCSNELWMVSHPYTSVGLGEIAGADSDKVDAVHFCDLLNVIYGFRIFDENADHDLAIRFLDMLLSRHGAIARGPARRGHTAVSEW